VAKTQPTSIFYFLPGEYISPVNSGSRMVEPSFRRQNIQSIVSIQIYRSTCRSHLAFGFGCSQSICLNLSVCRVYPTIPRQFCPELRMKQKREACDTVLVDHINNQLREVAEMVRLNPFIVELELRSLLLS
jgi:hypothetical protein